MTVAEYKTLRERIETRYQADLAALERIWGLFRGDTARPEETSNAPAGRSRRKLTAEEKKAKQRAYYEAWKLRRKKKGRLSEFREEEKGIPPGEFSKFLVKGPRSAGGNGEE